MSRINTNVVSLLGQRVLHKNQADLDKSLERLSTGIRINSGADDPGTDSIMVNSVDGNLYRWNLASNTLSQTVTLTTGYDEAYTPTVIGVDGTVYAIQDGILFAVGN